ncbi:hypothetical protein AVEN_70255-1 [Araneus ventricosus]|uniref:Uncharacterized protein n=1 Tax=Araneus ventricosus TaxID=182803 RepID=A0A4Y2GAI0_ARAVE|nr:hypothetical protein AVEN_70255-1 [Araneus ventricosus]
MNLFERNEASESMRRNPCHGPFKTDGIKGIGKDCTDHYLKNGGPWSVRKKSGRNWGWMMESIFSPPGGFQGSAFSTQTRKCSICTGSLFTRMMKPVDMLFTWNARQVAGEEQLVPTVQASLKCCF